MSTSLNGSWIITDDKLIPYAIKKVLGCFSASRYLLSQSQNTDLPGFIETAFCSLIVAWIPFCIISYLPLFAVSAPKYSAAYPEATVQSAQESKP
jgi:hypothetical protein